MIIEIPQAVLRHLPHFCCCMASSSSSSSSSLMLLIVAAAVLLAPSMAALCDKNDKAVLLRIKSELGNPSELASWTGGGCCSWRGVECDFLPPHRRVVNLTITDSSSISAPIPPSIAGLTALRYLVFARLPRLTGPFPTALASLPSLAQLTIASTALSGPVPSLPSLTIYNLSSNRLIGPIPVSLGGAAFSTLDLSGNALTGPIPPSLLFNATNNPDLDLSRNRLTGPLPPAFTAVDFATVVLARNALTGGASLLFGASKRTTVIDLAGNGFRFDLSGIEMPAGVERVDLSGNRITGRIPESVAGLARLTAFNVSGNQLCGMIPAGGRMALFGADSYLNNKCLCGAPLPPCSGGSSRRRS